MQEIENKKRVWPALSEDVYADLVIYAAEEKRKLSEMAAIFIENAIKERKRKRNGKTKNNTKYHPSDLGKSDRE